MTSPTWFTQKVVESVDPPPFSDNTPVEFDAVTVLTSIVVVIISFLPEQISPFLTNSYVAVKNDLKCTKSIIIFHIIYELIIMVILPDLVTINY